MGGGVTQKMGLGIIAKVLVAQLCPTLCHPMDCSSPGSSVHGILQVRILGWVVVPSSRGSSDLKSDPHLLCLLWQVGSLSTEPSGKPYGSTHARKKNHQFRVESGA